MPIFNKDEDKRRRLKLHAIELSGMVEEVVKNDSSKKAVLLCEGKPKSIDASIYSLAYPDFIVIPVEGCTDVRRLMPFMKKYCSIKTFGLIDRDNHSKKGIKTIKDEEGVYCTKLPFIENIICCPEVLKIVAPLQGKDYYEVVRKVKTLLADILADKLKLLNPFNVSFPSDEEIQMFTITIVTRNNMVVHKVVNLDNIMYTFRDKVIVVEVAYTLGLHNKENYYTLIKNLLNGENSSKLISIMSKYLPEIKVD